MRLREGIEGNTTDRKAAAAAKNSGFPPRKGARYAWPQIWKVALVLCVIFVALPASSQNVQLQVLDSNGYAVSQNGTVYISPSDQNNYPMPKLQITFTNNSSCTVTISATLTVSWTDNDPTGCNPPKIPFATQGTISTNLSVPANSGSPWDLAPTWLGATIAAGGTANLTWSVNGTAQTAFTFNILQYNSTKTEVDSDYSGIAPWFYGNLINLESGGYQACPSGRPYCSQYYPFVVNNPDGIGLGQVDGCYNTPLPGTYWNHNSNIQLSISILNSDSSSAEGAWRNEVGQMETDEGNSANYVFPPSENFYNGSQLECSFYASNQSPSYGNYGDANWIQAYNSNNAGKYYIWWSPQIDGEPAAWYFYDQVSQTYASHYVDYVCTSAKF